MDGFADRGGDLEIDGRGVVGVENAHTRQPS
jgi:hypothetical protein